MLPIWSLSRESGEFGLGDGRASFRAVSPFVGCSVSHVWMLIFLCTLWTFRRFVLNTLKACPGVKSKFYCSLPQLHFQVWGVCRRFPLRSVREARKAAIAVCILCHGGISWRSALHLETPCSVTGSAVCDVISLPPLETDASGCLRGRQLHR